MSIFSRNDKIVKIMDAAGNTIIDLNTLHQTDIVQTDCSMPLYFTAEAAGKLSAYTIQGNTVNYQGVGNSVNFLNPLMCTIVSRWLSTADNGKVMNSADTQYTGAKSIIFMAPTRPGYYTMSCKNSSGAVVDRMRIGVFYDTPDVGTYADVMDSSYSTASGYTSNTFSVPLGAKYIMAYLWSGTDDTEGITDEEIEAFLANQEFQLREGQSVLGYVAPVIDRVQVIVKGKNLFDIASHPYVNGWVTSSTNKWYLANTVFSVIVPVAPGITYTISKITSNRCQIATFQEYPKADDTCRRKIQFSNSATSGTFTTAEGENYAVFLFQYGTSVTEQTINNILNSIQLEPGIVATEYQQYQEHNISIPINGALLLYDGVNQNSGADIPFFAGVNEITVISKVPPKHVKISAGRIDSFDDA